MALEDFYTGYMSNRLEAGEFVQAIEVPLGSRAEIRAFKISKRFDCDISALCAGLAIELDDAGNVIAARLAFGGMAATVKRAAQAEAALVGQPVNQANFRKAAEAALRDAKPQSENAFKIELAKRCLTHALQMATA